MKAGWRVLALLVIGVSLSLSIAIAIKTSRNQLLDRLLSADMHHPNEALPQGVPLDFNWARRPRVNMGNNPGGFRALLGWGQLYPCASDRSVPTTTVELRDLDTWVLSRSSGRWTLAQASSQVTGAAYREDYLNNESVPADIQSTKAGGTVVTMLPKRNFHFWEATGRTEIDPTDIMGIAVTLHARLTDSAPANSANHDCLALSVGADYWLSRKANWTSHGRTVKDVGIGRFKIVKPAWRLYTMTSASTTTLSDHQLPYSVSPSELY